MLKKNCWEFKKCGREPGGANVAASGVCPAANEAAIAETNSGKNGCRACWAINGKFSRELVPGSPPNRLGDCLQCDFLKQNENEDGLYDIIIREVISLM
jgi:hypothetical protein